MSRLDRSLTGIVAARVGLTLGRAEGFPDSGEIAGRVDFKDGVEDGCFIYRGHIHQL